MAKEIIKQQQAFRNESQSKENKEKSSVNMQEEQKHSIHSVPSSCFTFDASEKESKEMAGKAFVNASQYPGMMAGYPQMHPQMFPHYYPTFLPPPPLGVQPQSFQQTPVANQQLPGAKNTYIFLSGFGNNN